MRIKELLEKLSILIVDKLDVILSEKTLFHSLNVTGVAVPAARGRLAFISKFLEVGLFQPVCD